ncbi:sensor histidine kinase [Hymenobacter sp. HSC-4F20]|uniref:sensor histidine kinase n=1 Tax=Hymenobacter sp. HSC-4F20 TaxID=2864135 RepID=UPI001C72F4B1|nr:sensor histidine kinase [Hymenobacter sp. HSC-4F20]MBX0291282.1 sensor histidine kinase [Hymenobacter sp. HSC-4F20]
MEVPSASVAASLVEESVPTRVGWRAWLRPMLRPANWSATSEHSPIPRSVHVLLWLWLFALDALKLGTALAALPRFPATAAEWQPALPLLGRLLLEDMCGALLFYLTWRWLIPRTLGRARIVQYLALAALLVLPYAALLGWVTTQTSRKGAQISAYRVPATGNRQKAVADAIKEHKEKPPMPEFWMRIISSGIIGAFIVGSSSALRITGDYIRGQRNRREMERQQLLTELAMLKTQINPHFLFNTLNNIYSLTSRKSDKAPEAVLRLAEIMRYLLYESSTDTVPLSRELDHLRSFLDLQRLRLSASAQEAIQFEVSGTSLDCAHPIAPLLLLPLVENAFKHGDLTARPLAVHISLSLASDGLLRFSVLNHVAPADAERELPRQPGGVGLVNLRRRLELLYPGRYVLDVQTPPGQHLVTLVLLR